MTQIVYLVIKGHFKGGKRCSGTIGKWGKKNLKPIYDMREIFYIGRRLQFGSGLRRDVDPLSTARTTFHLCDSVSFKKLFARTDGKNSKIFNFDSMQCLRENQAEQSANLSKNFESFLQL